MAAWTVDGVAKVVAAVGEVAAAAWAAKVAVVARAAEVGRAKVEVAVVAVGIAEEAAAGRTVKTVVG